MAIKGIEPRPDDGEYYSERTDYVRQGDLFGHIPLGYSFPEDAEEHKAGARTYLSGPFEIGFAMLLTPSCAMSAQGEPGKYATAIRAMAPVLPLEQLVDNGAIKAGALDDMRAQDHLINYLYVPAIPEADLPESVALLYAPIVVHHDYLEGQRLAQLSEVAEVHLKYKLSAHVSGFWFTHADFERST